METASGHGGQNDKVPKEGSCVRKMSYKESIKSTKRTAVSGSFFGASLGFHATMNRADADFTL